MSVNNVGKKVNIDALQAGVEKKNIKTDEERLIFDALDTDGNGVLDNTELSDFLTATNTNDDGVIKKNEAKKFINNNAVLKEHKLDKKALLVFLHNILENAENVESVVEIGEGDAKQVKIIYKNNTSKVINADQSYQTHAVTNGEDVVENYTNNDLRTQKMVVSQDNKHTTVTDYEADGTTPTLITETNEEQHTVSATKFEEGKKVQNVTTNSADNSIAVIDYSEERPVQKTVTKGTVTEISTFDEAGNEFLSQKKEELGGGNVRTTNYTYYERGKKVETIEPNGDVTTTVYNESDKKLAQLKRVGGNDYSVEYDGNGNTRGIIVQSSEDLSALAKKYGCTTEQLKALNQDCAFKPGDSISVPGEIDASDKRYITQKPAEQVKEEVRIEAKQKEVQRRQEAKLKKQLAPFGIVDLANNGKKRGEYTIMGNGMFGTTIAIDKKSHVVVLDKKTGKSVNLNKHCNKVIYARGKKVKLSSGQSVVINGVRNDGHGRKFAVDASGKVHVVSWDNKSLKEEYIADSDAADYGQVRIAYHTRNLPDGQRIGVGSHGYAFKGVHSPEFDKDGKPVRHQHGGSVNANAVINAEVKAIRVDLGDCSDRAIVHSVVTEISDPRVIKGLTDAYSTDFCSKLETELGEQVGLRETAVLVRNGAIDDQERRNDIIKRNIITYGDNIENLCAGYSAITTVADKEAAIKAAKNHNKTQGYTAPYSDLTDLDVLTYGQTDGEAFAIRKANTALYKDETGHNKRILDKDKVGNQKYVNLFARSEQITSRAAEASYFLNDGDLKGALAIADGEILKRVDALRKGNSEQSIHDLTLNNANDMAKVIETGYIPYEDEEIVATALKTVIGSYKGDRQGTYARHYKETIQNLLRTPGSANMFKKILNNDPKYTTVLANREIDAAELGKYVRGKIGFSYDRAYSYSLITKEPSNMAQCFPPEILEEYQNQYDYIKDSVDMLQQGWDGIVDDEGAIDKFLNDVRTIGFGGYKPEIGVVRKDVNSVLKNARRQLNDLGLSANFRLHWGDGKEVFFEDLVENLDLNKLGTSVQGLQAKYQEHQAYANAGLDIALCFVGPGAALKGIGTIVKITKAAKGVKVATAVVNGGTRVAAAMDASAIGRVTMAVGEAVGTGSAVGAGTFAALETKNKINHWTSTTGGSEARREQDFNNALKMAEISGFSAIGGHLIGSGLVKTLQSVNNTAGRAALTTTAIGGQVGVDYAAMRTVYGEDMRPVDFAMSLIGGAFGNVMALRSAKGRTGKAPEPASSTLAQATKHQAAKAAPIEIAQPATVVLKNEQNINKIIAEVKQNAPTTDGAGLAQTERQIAAISNRDLRRQLTAEIEKAKANLSSEQLNAYKVEQYAINAEDVVHILQRGNGLKEADFPVIESFVANTPSISVLEDLHQGLRNVQYNGGGCTSNEFAILDNVIKKRVNKILNEISEVEVLKQYKAALNEKNAQIINGSNSGYNGVLQSDANNVVKAIDDRIAAIERSSSSELLGQHINEMLDAKKLANKGLAPEDVAMISEYIPSITSETELAALRKNVFDRRMTTQNKKALQEVFDNKAAELKANTDADSPTSGTRAKEEPQSSKKIAEEPVADEHPVAEEHVVEESHISEEHPTAEEHQVTNDVAVGERQVPSANNKFIMDTNTIISEKATAVLNETGMLTKTSNELIKELESKTNVENLKSSYGNQIVGFVKDGKRYHLYYNAEDELSALMANDVVTGRGEYFSIKNNKITQLDFDDIYDYIDEIHQIMRDKKISELDNVLKQKMNMQEFFEHLDMSGIKETRVDIEKDIIGLYGQVFEKKNSIVASIGDEAFQIFYDNSGNIVKYIKWDKTKGIELAKCYIFNKKGVAKPVTLNKFKKYQKYDKPTTGVAQELLLIMQRDMGGIHTKNGASTFNIDIETLLKNNGNKVSRFDAYTVRELNKLVKTADDGKILNALLKDKKLNIPINSQLKTEPLSLYTYSCDDILSILKSEEAKAFILEKLNSGSSFNKSDLKKLNRDLFIEPSSYKLESVRDLSHQIEDLQLRDATGALLDDYTLNNFFEQSSEFRQKIPIGEVGNINGHMYVNDNGHLVKLAISREKFEELFPIEKRHKISQGALGDCWLITSMGALMDSPKGRVAIYKMFAQEGNDILIKFPDAEEAIRFKNGKLNTLSPISFWFDGYKPKFGKGNSQVDASMGVRMLEQAYSIHRNDGYRSANISNGDIQDIFFMNKRMHRLTAGCTVNAIEEIVGKDKVIGNMIYNNSLNSEEIISKLELNINDPNKIITFGTKHGISGNTEYDLFEKHAYHVVNYDKVKGTVSISNPWHNNEIREIPVNDWINYVNHFDVIELI